MITYNTELKTNFRIFFLTTTTTKSTNRVGIRTCSDYSPFGVELDGRTVSFGYRYGYQGSEKDDARLDEPARHIAYSTAYRLGVTSIGSAGSVYPEIVDGKETGKLKTDGVFKMYKWNAEKETMEVKELGRTIDPIDYSPKE